MLQLEMVIQAHEYEQKHGGDDGSLSYHVLTAGFNRFQSNENLQPCSVSALAWSD